MFISNSIVSYIFNKKKISILLIISLYFGWGVLKAKSLYFNKLNRFKSYSVLYYNQFLGFLKNYSVFFKFKGMGIKLIGHSQGLIFKVGNSHRVFLSKHKEIKYIYSKKRLLLLKSRASFFFL